MITKEYGLIDVIIDQTMKQIEKEKEEAQKRIEELSQSAADEHQRRHREVALLLQNATKNLEEVMKYSLRLRKVINGKRWTGAICHFAYTEKSSRVIKLFEFALPEPHVGLIFISLACEKDGEVRIGVFTRLWGSDTCYEATDFGSLPDTFVEKLQRLAAQRSAMVNTLTRAFYDFLK